MRRRKLLIGIGAATAGGSAAFGTEAFTSVEAERSVDVTVAGDQSAYLALAPANSANADTYVTQSGSGNVIQVDLDGDDSASGGGVNNNAITTFDDLFTILNQGAQPVSVYVEDSSDAVTFRSDDSSIEGASNSVELAVGEEMVVSITVDTTGGVSVGDTLTDSVTLWATADDPSPGGTAPVASFNQVVKPDQYEDASAFADDPRYFADIGSALDAASEGDNVGIDADSGPHTVSSPVTVDTPGVTIAGTSESGGSGTPRIENSGVNAGDGVFEVDVADVTIQNLEIATLSSATSGAAAPREILITGGDDATVASNVIRRPDGNGGTVIDGNPEIAALDSANVAITGNDLSGGAISFNGSGGSAVDNVVANVQTEGIFAFGGIGNEDFTIQGNTVTGHDNGESGSREIKLTEEPATLNSGSNLDEQFSALIRDNDVNTVRIAGNDGVTVDAGGSGSNLLSTVSNGISEVGTNGFVLIDGGTYDENQLSPESGMTVQGINGATLDSGGDIIRIDADDVTLRGLTVINGTHGLDVTNAAGPTGLLVENCSFDGHSIGMYVANANEGSNSTFDDVTIRNTTFNDNLNKGIYAEKLHNATFDNIEVRNSGTADPYASGPAGIDINLKWDDYSDITIRNSTFADSGIEASGMFHPDAHGALLLKARGTGSDSSYDARPATLTNVVVEDNEFTFSASTQANTETVAIRPGEPGLSTSLDQPTPGEELTVSGNQFENADHEVRDLTQ
jgi:hypothetical protein